ncbi:MAG: tRNA preQ1(34) S-adenosylmethionine ribosyltransferase-isomerase QueA [Actinomycetota bacterium]|nr:tRNA preQ1(34) S-adenosylmethionine ribosyltransferase-isomerase QueA [Actinomycetota bacterium]
MRIGLFDYDLPPEFIAQRPVEPRENSRLMVVNCESGTWEHLRFGDLPTCLESGDCLVLNRSRVRRSRLRGSKVGGGGKVEILLLRRQGNDVWEVLARPARRLRPGVELIIGEGALRAKILEKGERGCFSIHLYPGESGEVEELVERIGEVPLPPYIKEGLEDPQRYQTIYAGEVGSAAALTAGLHFEIGTLQRLLDIGVRLASLRLDVGLDTFRPIQEEEVEKHRLHSEELYLDEEECNTINITREKGHRIVAVGTTVVRALESAISGDEVLPFSGSTDLFIYPGFRFRAVDALVTNFHLPKSSLLLMVCAFAGRELVMSVYRDAMEEGYRFLSFGDACLFYFPRGRRTFDHIFAQTVKEESER